MTIVTARPPKRTRRRKPAADAIEGVRPALTQRIVSPRRKQLIELPPDPEAEAAVKNLVRRMMRAPE